MQGAGLPVVAVGTGSGSPRPSSRRGRRTCRCRDRPSASGRRGPSAPPAAPRRGSARLGHQPAPRLGHHRDVAEARADHAHHRGGVVLGRRHLLAVEGREAAADVEQRSACPRAPRVQSASAASSAPPTSPARASASRRGTRCPPRRARGSARDPSAAAPRPARAELAAERPVGLRGLDQHPDDHPRAGRVRARSCAPPPRHRPRTAARRRMGPGDVLGRLIVLPKAIMLGRHAEPEAERDLAARGRVEPAAHRRGQRRDHLGRRVGLDRVVDDGIAETGASARYFARRRSRSNTMTGPS
jgi:hypothetical protein